MIPKIIHYCWFGRNPKPKLAKKCIKSWKKYCPDYEIIEWNEDNFDISSAPLYVRQAYEAKMWAFVTDYVRLWAMTQFGGIYMDSDVQVIKPLDSFLCHKAFSGFENDKNIPTGIMACEKGFPLFLEFLRYYDTAKFLNDKGKPIKTTNVEIMTSICLKYGLVQNNQFQVIQGFALYPKDYFCPISYATNEMKKTRNTTTIHWFAASWHTESQRKAYKRRVAKGKRERIRLKMANIELRAKAILKAIVGEKRYRMIKWCLGRRDEE